MAKSGFELLDTVFTRWIAHADAFVRTVLRLFRQLSCPGHVASIGQLAAPSPIGHLNMTRIYVGNLSRETTETELGAALTAGGRTVAKVMLKRDGDSGVSRGFAFVDMGSPEEAAGAIASLNGTQLGGRTIKVAAAKELPGPRTSWREAAGETGGRGRPRW
jgi:RNA recognition motif-containing protein